METSLFTTEFKINMNQFSDSKISAYNYICIQNGNTSTYRKTRPETKFMSINANIGPKKGKMFNKLSMTKERMKSYEQDIYDLS